MPETLKTLYRVRERCVTCEGRRIPIYDRTNYCSIILTLSIFFSIFVRRKFTLKKCQTCRAICVSCQEPQLTPLGVRRCAMHMDVLFAQHSTPYNPVTPFPNPPNTYSKLCPESCLGFVKRFARRRNSR